MEKKLELTILDFESYHDNGVSLYFGDLEMTLDFCPETGALVADEDTLFKSLKEKSFELYVAGQRFLESDASRAFLEPEIEKELKSQLSQSVEEKLSEMKYNDDYERTLDSMRGPL